MEITMSLVYNGEKEDSLMGPYDPEESYDT